MLRQMATPLLAVALLLRRISAAPVTPLEADILAANWNITTLRTQLAPSWSTTSPIRSTAGILWTAVTTLSLCVYTVIHVNVPLRSETRWKFYRRKAWWVLAAILAPEYALWAAFEQWDSARLLRNKLQKYKPEERNETGPVEKEGQKMQEEKMNSGWSYCFYVVMGGLTVNVSAINPEFQYMTVTPAGLCLLAEYSRLPHVSRKSIKDRSKADGLAKLLVCVQVAWLIIQSIERAARDLPIALLEIHVLAHVACALLLYGLWFKKPLDIHEATMVNSSGFDDELALMLLISQASEENRKRWRDEHKANQAITAENWLKLLTEDVIMVGEQRGQPQSNKTCGDQPHVDEMMKRAKRAAEKLLEARTRNDPASNTSQWFEESNSSFLVYRAKDVLLQTLLEHFNLISPRRQLFPLHFDSHFLISSAMVCLAAVYAAIHLAAWRYHFPTDTEMWLWRASSLTIAGVLPAILFLITLAVVMERMGMTLYTTQVTLFICGLLVLVYVVARFFLFIESFISLRQMPIGVFVTMQWSDYIPHV
ncbi:hypothetical protein F5B22DRAFT_623967 [Xylaria bambusicola]|uniref:uncharacterized protein n=1 Tax=Xylaria bambusicola TaxID=326684 RepID=UPI002007FB37|nr:uncharacterized protein F5B22DRAFT_623967 [Xylaria bambusicola]KAI0506364.1 hypothetical protein F5B22DRAFT_623967 [Xylaria bambusicola]